MEIIKNIDNGEDLLKILNAAIDKIYKKEENIPKIQNITNDELNYIANIFSQYCSSQLTKSEMLDFFVFTNPEMKDYVLKAIENRKSNVSKYILMLHNSQQLPLMTSFDWDLKFITGSSTLASHREQKSTLIFECASKKTSETLSLEICKDMIDKMINELELISGVE